jgi:hypothetical protein
MVPALFLAVATSMAAARHDAVPLLAPSAPPPSWQYTNCSSCLGAGLLWCYLDDKCWTHFAPGDRSTQACKLNLEWCAAGSECACTTCGDRQCQLPPPAPNPPPTPPRMGGVQQVHLAIGKIPGAMTVAWATDVGSSPSAPAPAVKYGLAGRPLLAHTRGDTRLLNVTGSRNTHVATMTGLEPGRTYEYQVDGDSVGDNPFALSCLRP